MKKQFEKLEGGRRRLLYAALLVAIQALVCNSVLAQTAVGKWRSWLDYSRVTHLAYAGDRIYAGAIGGVFCYDIGNSTLTPMSTGD